MAKFFGDEVCVSYRWNDKRSTDSECKQKCFSIHEDDGVEKETYETDVICSTISCGGGYKRLKFVATAKANNNVKCIPVLLTIAALLVMIITA